jgi:hypothetical protein
MHEAIHHSLYMAELSSPMVLDSAACAEIRPLSPWTGNLLTVHSYLHACLVWFGLLRLWSRPGAEQLGVEAVGARLEVLRGGFARGSLVTPIADALPGLAPWVPALLEELLEAASA